jgi:hypothetical protein
METLVPNASNALPSAGLSFATCCHPAPPLDSTLLLQIRGPKSGERQQIKPAKGANRPPPILYRSQQSDCGRPEAAD